MFTSNSNPGGGGLPLPGVFQEESAFSKICPNLSFKQVRFDSLSFTLTMTYSSTDKEGVWILRLCWVRLAAGIYGKQLNTFQISPYIFRDYVHVIREP